MSEFRMPSLGADMDEGTLLEWLVEPGDRVHRGDIVAVVDTTKSAVEVESFEDGVVEKLVVDPGTVVPVGGVLARFGTIDHERTDRKPEAPVTAPEVPEAPPEFDTHPRAQRPSPGQDAHPSVVASPLVRRYAEELGVDLSSVPGSGGGGRVTRHDVEVVAHGIPAEPPAHPGTMAPATTPPTMEPREGTGSHRARVSPLARRLAAEAGIDLGTLTGTGPMGAVRADDVRAAARVAAGSPSHEAPAKAAPPPAAHDMRGAIAALMSRSKREIPHYYLTATVDLHATVTWIHERNRDLDVGDRLVPSAALLCAAARAARAVPELNGHWVDGGFHPAATVDLGLVLSLRGGGLLVPVINGADTLGIGEVMARMRDVTRKARAGRLRGSDLRPPSITVTNLGDQGVESVQGVIYPPQVGIVGFGAVSDRPWAVDGLLGVRPLVTVTLAADHRASDAATGARLLKTSDTILQKPEEL
jgi:pyruvate dehydrogenase E2 component (dihydrolipoamide acetyltransferase)